MEDIKQFLKVYRAYKKGKREMEKAKEFVEQHSKEIVLAFGLLAFYQLGFKRGFRKGIKFEDALISMSLKGGK